MLFKKIYPSKNISNIVQFFWEFEGDFSTSIPYQQPIVASIAAKLAFQYEGNMFLTCNNKKNQLFKSGFQGQSNSYGLISASQKMGIFGIYFHPYAASFLFNIPAYLITNCNIEISDLLGRKGKELEEKIMLSKNSDERIKIIINFIEFKLKSNTTQNNNIIASTNHIIFKKGNINIPDLAKKYSFSQRHFERKFKDVNGFSPKVFSRIVRFEELISKGVVVGTSLTAMAYDMGYYDQSHMIKDFKEFTGQNPQNYFSEELSIFFE